MYMSRMTKLCGNILIIERTTHSNLLAQHYTADVFIV